MAIYKKLHLASGGGIFSKNQQADQKQNTATILIGLGGMGIDCIKNIKEQIYKRIKPDNFGDFIPEYSHIQCIGIDTDPKSAEILNPEDFLDISYFGSMQDILQNEMGIRSREEWNWLRSDKIREKDIEATSKWSIRQLGRFLMFQKSSQFMELLEKKIQNSISCLVQSNIYVHIFTGSTGGTGSGIFLDICYMVREVLVGKPYSNILGYVFLPDIHLNTKLENTTETCIKKNGYAFLQELDYCMNLEKK